MLASYDIKIKAKPNERGGRIFQDQSEIEEVLSNAYELAKPYPMGAFSNSDFLCEARFNKVGEQTYNEIKEGISDFTGSIFKKNAIFSGITFKGPTSFAEAEFEGEVFFDEAIFEQKVVFYEVEFWVNANFSNTSFRKLADFWSAHFHQPTDFYKTRFVETVVFTDSTFDYNATFTFAHLGNMLFRQAKFHGKLDLSLAANIDWSGNFFDIPRNFIVSKDVKVSFKNQRETFRIIKDQLLKQNNNIEALYYRSLEMQAYNEELNESEGRDAEKLLMGINQSNDYGVNYIKPAFILLIINLLFTKLILITQYQCPCDNSKFWSLYWQLLDPVIKPHELFENEPSINGWTYFVFFVSRLFLAYFIFQTISAFRKHSK